MSEPWMTHANCAGVDPAVMFPGEGGNVRPAKRICAGCTVRDECLRYALDTGVHFGVWGGTSEGDRRRLRRGQPRMPEHGTRRRYQRGCRCDDCREANADYIHRRRTA